MSMPCALFPATLPRYASRATAEPPLRSASSFRPSIAMLIMDLYISIACSFEMSTARWFIAPSLRRARVHRVGEAGVGRHRPRLGFPPRVRHRSETRLLVAIRLHGEGRKR